MLDTKEQKIYFAVSVALIIILGGISLWNRVSFVYVDKTDYAKIEQERKQQAEAYQKYLDSLKVDPAASKELFQEILTKEDVQKEVEAALETDQTIEKAEVADADLVIGKDKGQQAVIDYLTNTVGPVYDFNKSVIGISKALFTSGDTATPDAVLSEYQVLQDKIMKAEVPQEAVALQKALVSSLLTYKDLLQTAKQYSAGQDSNPWPQVYNDYVAINDNATVYGQEFQKLEDKYKLSALPALRYAENEDGGFALIPAAHAFLGIGDVTITIGDIPRLIMDGIEQGLASSFSQFMGQFIQKLVNKIESNYMISNFLYYSDALVNAQYTNDYLNKYVQDELDKQMIRTFVPQFNCGQQPQNLKPVFQSKANQYLGFEPEAVDPGDPDYYAKLAKVGEFLASESGWSINYQSMAAQAQSEAEKAAQQELLSPGLKTPRDLVNNKTAKSVNSITSAEQAAMIALMTLGGQNAKSFISGFVAQLTQSLMNNFVLRGVSGNQMGVYKEQPTCLSAAQIQLVLPTDDTSYQTPPPAPTEDQVLCHRYPSLCPTQPRGGN